MPESFFSLDFFTPKTTLGKSHGLIWNRGISIMKHRQQFSELRIDEKEMSNVLCMKKKQQKTTTKKKKQKKKKKKTRRPSGPEIAHLDYADHDMLH